MFSCIVILLNCYCYVWIANSVEVLDSMLCMSLLFPCRDLEENWYTITRRWWLQLYWSLIYWALKNLLEKKWTFPISAQFTTISFVPDYFSSFSCQICWLNLLISLLISKILCKLSFRGKSTNNVDIFLTHSSCSDKDCHLSADWLVKFLVGLS